MMHIETLQKVLQRRALLSKEKVLEENITYRSIALDTVQRLRDRIFIWDYAERKFRSLHSYVPFYFATHTPMLYHQYGKGVQNEIVILALSRSILSERGVLFTDGNASNQQLSVYGPEVVYITPTTSSRECRRQYRPHGPHGTNTNISNFFADISFLTNLNWESINARDFSGDDEKRRIKHAEVLIPDILPLEKIKEIIVSNYETAKKVDSLIAANGLAQSAPWATINPNMFFR